jgi:PAS domain-containing protein
MADIQQQLEESREKYVELFDNSPVGYLTLNNKGLIEDINITGSNLPGYDISRFKEYPLNIFIDRKYSIEFLNI